MKPVLERLRPLIIAKQDPATLKHAARTTFAALASLLVARLFRLPETYWAAISTLIVMQSNLGTTLPISMQRFVGTAVGAIFGGFVGMYFPGNVAAFGVALFAIGILSASFKVERTAYRHAGITLLIVTLVPRAANEWLVAMHRFFEVSIGIGVGLAVSAVWPEATHMPPDKIEEPPAGLRAEEGS